jgi:hypothetical protein
MSAGGTNAGGMSTGATGRVCDACGEAKLAVFAELGDFPVRCGAHWDNAVEAASSGSGRVTLASCGVCGFVRNVNFDWDLVVYDTTVDTNLHHSPAFQAFSEGFITKLAERHDLRGRHIVELACMQGDFLRRFCELTGATGDGYDAMYAGPAGTDPSGATLHRLLPPTGDDLPGFDFVVSRHWLEHVDDPFGFLVDVRQRANGREVHGFLEIPDAAYDMSTAGWEIIYPHVSYFDGYSLTRILERAGWRVEETEPIFHGVLRYAEISANRPAGAERLGTAPLPTEGDRDRQLANIAGFAERHFAERGLWTRRVATWAGEGRRPVLWGAGSRGVQFLTLADADHHLAAVVDVSPRKWGRYLPVTAHRVDPPASLAQVKPEIVVITNPAYRTEIAGQLAQLGVDAELVVA